MHRLLFSLLLLLTILLILMPSCMKDKPEELPSQLQWNPQLAFPVGHDAFGMNEESGFPEYLYDIDSTTGLPYWVNRDVLRMWGNVEFDLDAVYGNIDYVVQMLFRINMENGFPDEMLVQGYFTDQNRQPLDSLFDGGAIPLPPASIGDQGQVLKTSIIRKDVAYSKDDILLLDQAAYLVFQGKFYTVDVDTALVDYYPDFRIKTDVGVMLDLSIDHYTWQ